MFGIGLGEIILILVIIFLISPKEVPKILKKIAQFLNGLQKIKNEILDLEDDVKDVINSTNNNDDLKNNLNEDIYRNKENHENNEESFEDFLRK